MPFDFQRMNIPDVILIKPRIFTDERGYFLESYKQSDFNTNGISERFTQDNLSHSVKCVIRGLHFQVPPYAQGKLVMAIQGEIFDVAVDIRKESPTYRKWVSQNLSEDNQHILYVPPGFAHGFCVLSDFTTVLYKCTKEYASQHDCGVIWNDPDINIKWPVDNPILSEKDLALPQLIEVDNPF